MAESSDGKSKFDKIKEFMSSLTEKERKDIRRGKNKKFSRRHQVDSEDVRTDAEPFNSADFEKIRVEEHHDRQDIDDRQQNRPMAVENSYHDSHEVLESTCSISGEDKANIVQNDRNVFQHQTGATPVESSYHGSNETAETSSSAVGDTSLKRLVPTNDNIARPVVDDTNLKRLVSTNECQPGSQNKLQSDEIGEVHSNQIASGHSNEHIAVENSYHSRSEQTELQYLKEKIRSLEEEMARSQQRLNLHDEVEDKISNEVSDLQAVGHRKYEAHCNDIKSLQEAVQSLSHKLQRVENENARLNRSVMFPASVDEWLGVDIDSIRRTVLNEKMIIYFSKVFYSPTLNITGIHLGFNESDVDRYTCDSNGTSRESCRLLLKHWCNKMGDKATIGYLLESLYRLSQHEPSCIDKLSLDVALQKAKNSKY